MLILTAVKESYATPNTTWFSGINRFLKKNIKWGFSVKLAETAEDEATYFKSAGAKVQGQILKIKNKFVASHFL